MDTTNHFESETPCYRIAHDGEGVISVTFGSGKTSSKHAIITADSWEHVTEKLNEEGITLGDVLIPQEESDPFPEPDLD